MQVLVKCQEVYCRKSCRTTPLALDTTAGNKLVITQIATNGIQDVHVPFAPAAVLPGPTACVEEGINKEPVIIQAPSTCLLQSYEDVGQAAFGDKGRAFITAVLYTELIGTCALFFILEVSTAANGTHAHHAHACALRFALQESNLGFKQQSILLTMSYFTRSYIGVPVDSVMTLSC